MAPVAESETGGFLADAGHRPLIAKSCQNIAMILVKWGQLCHSNNFDDTSVVDIDPPMTMMAVHGGASRGE